MSATSPDPSWMEGILQRLSPSEREALMRFLEDLLRIRASDASSTEKLKQTANAMRGATKLWPVLREMGGILKQHAWNGRSSPTRWGMMGAAGALAVFGSQGMGIAAFGGAIGLPLWIVFGAGAALAKSMINNLRRDHD